MKVVVAGALANKPGYGGEAWVRLAWIRGLRALGVETLFVERLAGPVPGQPPSEHDPLEPGRRFFETVVSRMDLEGVVALIGPGGDAIAGVDLAAASQAASESDLLVNISGHLRPGDPVFEAARRRAYVDLDPGFTQFWHAEGVGGLALDRHHVHFTVGWNLGREACPIPTSGIDWIPFRQPVVLGDWPRCPLPDKPRFTTVASWRGAYGPVEFGGRRYGLKVHEFRRFLDLPGSVSASLEVALDIHPRDSADRERLLAKGWRLVDPGAVAGSPEAFRDYVVGSLGEFSVAQNIYVATASGWFSDRSVRYLATGRPVVVQDTGIGSDLPVGRGLLTFASPAEAAAAIRNACRDPDGHAAAARRIAEEFFDATVVLPEVLERATACSGMMRAPAPNGPRTPPSPAAKAAARQDAPRGVIVGGMIAAVPGQGGASWAVLQYVLGLLRMGHDVHFVEEVDESALDPSDGPLDRTANWSYLTKLARRFGFADRVTLIARNSGRTAGLGADALRSLARRSRLLLNLSGTLTHPTLFECVPQRVYVDLDPAFTQLWHTRGIDIGLEGHTHFATVGLSIGTAGCRIPTCGVEWLRTLPPVVLEQWPESPAPPTRDAWTTVSHWRGYGSVDWEGRQLGQKAHAFRPLFPLPERTGDRFDVALAIHPDEKDDLASLRTHGWTLVDPTKVAGLPDRYRRFVQESAGEIGVAKQGYVVSESGWFSDRSACYLASGRPVVAQDTGFSKCLPTGSGLLAFSTLDEAAEAVRGVRADYTRHAGAARAFAENHLDSTRVLGALLAEVDR